MSGRRDRSLRVGGRALLLDLPIIASTEGLQQFALDLVARGHPVRCFAWPESQAERIWPEFAGLVRDLAPGEMLEEVGLRLSHATSFDSILNSMKIGLALWEEFEPVSAAAAFNQTDGLLVSTRTGSRRLRELGVRVPIERLTVEGLERLVSGQTCPDAFTAPLLRDGAATRFVAGAVPRVHLLILGDDGGPAPRAALQALRLARDRSGEQACTCIAVSLPAQAGAPVVEEHVLLLGRHHLAPPNSYLTPPVELVGGDLILGLRDLLELLPAEAELSCEALGVPRLENRLEALLETRGCHLSAGQLPRHVSHRPRMKVGLLGPSNIACGIAEEMRLLSAASPRPLTVFSERVPPRDLVHRPDTARRCYGRSDGRYGDLLRQVLQSGIDVLHVEYNHGLFEPEALRAAVRHLRMLGLHTVVTLHSTTEDVVALAAEFDEVIVNTEAARRRLAGWGVDGSHVHVVPLPARPLVRLGKAEARARLGLRAEPIVATCGFAFRHKGLTDLIKATAHLRAKYPRLLLVACCPPYPRHRGSARYLKECQRLVAELQLEEHVRFVARFLPMEELGEWLQAADALAFPYTEAAAQDASGAVRMALDAHRPIITSRLEMFHEVENAVLGIPPGDGALLVRALQMVLDDAGLERALIARAAATAEASSPREIARWHWCEVYRAFGDVPVHLEGDFQSCEQSARVLTSLALALKRLGCDVSISPRSALSETATPLPSPLAELASKAPREGLSLGAFDPRRPGAMWDHGSAVLLSSGASRLPEGLAQVLNRHFDWVLVPSRFCQEAALASGVDPHKVGRVPYGIDPERFHGGAVSIDLRRVAAANWYSRADLELDPPALFTFAHVGGASKDNGTDLLLEAYCQEFRGRDPVLLVVKSRLAEDVLGWIEQASERAADPPRIVYVREDVAVPLLPGYYAAGDCFVHPSRGDAFGLSVLEAMACARPAIVTGWGGPPDFCDADTSYLLDYELVPIDSGHGLLAPDAVWAQPDVGQLRALMRHLSEHRAGAAQKGRDAGLRAARWTWARTAYELLQVTSLKTDVEPGER